MKKVAIIEFYESASYYENYDKLILSITDWEEITEEEYNILCSNIDNTQYQVISQVSDQKEFIKMTVKNALEAAKKRKEAEEKRKKTEAEKKRQRELKKKAKTEAEEKALLEALLLKHGPKA